MHPNQVFMYSQTPSPYFFPAQPAVDKSMCAQGIPTPTMPNFTVMTQPTAAPMQMQQVPCVPQMMQPYQLISFPAPMVAPMMQTPPMAVYNPIQRQNHPLMEENGSFQPQNGPVDGNFQQWKRDPTYNWSQDQVFNPRTTQRLNSNLSVNNSMKFNHVNRNLKNYPRKSKKKYGFRSKQNMIDKVYISLVEKYEKRGILAGNDEVLRGDDTIRLHVKKFKALQRIEEALQAAERIDSVTISRVSIPLSMKNQFQKKGFLVYVQVEEVWMVPLAQKIFKQFDEFKKCDVARHTVDAEAKEEEQEQTADSEAEVSSAEPSSPTEVEQGETMIKEAAKPSEEELEDFDDLFAGPMIPQRSCGEMGQ